jgi:hypothetical protein
MRKIARKLPKQCIDFRKEYVRRHSKNLRNIIYSLSYWRIKTVELFPMYTTHQKGLSPDSILVIDNFKTLLFVPMND